MSTVLWIMMHAVDDWSLPGYVTLRELGRGGFGRVVLARHEAAGTLVAIKYLTVPDETFRTEFRDEAEILRGLRDPHVVRLYEYAETPHGSAIVMEAIDGVSLRDLLREHGVLEPEAALAVLKGSLLGLGAAHRAGVVHRDFKPPNVMVGGDGQSKLIDFGIALREGAAGQIVGTPAYMAPEQWAGVPASPSTDVYAATCVFFECVTGRTPYSGNTAEAYRTQHTVAEIPADDAPESVRELVRRGMAKDPAGRPAGALEFAAELEAAATAAYGPRWESNGWRRLAEAAAGLAALFPLAALVGSGSGGAAGHVAGAAAGKAAGGAAAAGGRGLLTKVLGANTATKVVAAATGAVVVGSAGVAAVVVARHKARPAPAPIRVELASYDRTATGLDLRGARYARVTGVRDAALRRKIDAALVDPLEWAVSELGAMTARTRPPCTKPSVLGARPLVGLTGPHLVSVEYELPKKQCFLADFELPHVVVTVDLRTGEALAASKVFRAGTLTAGGLATLMDRVSAHTTRQDLQRVCVDPPLRREDFDPGQADETGRPQPPRISAFLKPDGLEMTWSHIGSECPFYAVALPYREVRDLLDPKVAAELPA
jgi:predicted Ser/Thr protein kinase